MVRKLDLHEDAMFCYCGSAVAILGYEYEESARPIPMVLIAVSGWMNHRQLQVIEYLREENRVLREQLGAWRVRLNDNQRAEIGRKG